MDIIGKIAELLCSAFLSYCFPERHKEWLFPRGVDMVRITVSVEKAKEFPAVTEIAWVVPEPEISMS
jgi:hypothetical protein